MGDPKRGINRVEEGKDNHGDRRARGKGRDRKQRVKRGEGRETEGERGEEDREE